MRPARFTGPVRYTQLSCSVSLSGKDLPPSCKEWGGQLTPPAVSSFRVSLSFCANFMLFLGGSQPMTTQGSGSQGHAPLREGPQPMTVVHGPNHLHPKPDPLLGHLPRSSQVGWQRHCQVCLWLRHSPPSPLLHPPLS